MPHTLIADDQPHVREALRLLLKHEGHQIEEAGSPAAVLDSLRRRHFDLLLMDLNYALDTTSGQEGLDLLERVRRLDANVPVVVMTAWGNIPLAVEAMRRGARDFVEKPWDNDRLLAILAKQLGGGQASADASEVQEAHSTQERLLPRALPRLEAFEIAAAWRPAGPLSGDYFDVIRRGDGQVAVCVGDVVGKGLPAALLMSNLQAAIRALASDVLAPGALCARVNRLIADNLGIGKFITFFCGLLDERTRRLHYTNAGHNPPLLLRRSGEVERLECGGPVLGVFADTTYADCSVQLATGDRLVLFTDGVVELENPDGEAFGDDRLIAVLAANGAADAESLKTAVMAAAAAFGKFHDDATVVVVTVG